MKAISPTTSSGFQLLAFATLFVVLVGYLLIIGRSILLPIFIAVISVYVLVSASDWLGRQPITKHLPQFIRRMIVLLGFVAAIIALATVVIFTAGELVANAPIYQENLNTLVDRIRTSFGIDVPPDWAVIWEGTMGSIDVQSLIGSTLGSASSLGGVVFLVAVYAMFLMSERGSFAQKISVALPSKTGLQSQNIIASINASIGSYLAIKTLVNVMLAVASFIVMWVFGVDFALFWAILIGLLNYIPYVGSLVGVIFPVTLTLLQTGSIQTTLLVLGFLTCAQLLIGYLVEPKLIGKKVNLSPFIVMVSLSVWAAIWGLSGAILAIPMTSILTIILGHFATTRPIAVLLADDPDLVQGSER